LLPVIQKVYANLASIKLNKMPLAALHADLSKTGTTSAQFVMPVKKRGKPLPLRQCLELRNVTYTYPTAEQPSLINLSLTIPARSTTALVGSTGAGKTTVVDVVLGLLEPQNGEIVVDNIRVTSDNYPNWRQAIGYVPQHIFLADQTVAANIALGSTPDKIDIRAVERAACLADLHDFVARELPQSYFTKIGEGGVRLSGGQRQRIGIARALYHDPEVLILDEATNALDGTTERAILDALRNLTHRKTILIITHRLATVRACDRLFLLEEGRLKSQGTYDYLFATSQDFRQMAS
jgi:ABC-type multidrug transport system fused ATPase/permease subunit